jgi:hypothetical protein
MVRIEVEMMFLLALITLTLQRFITVVVRPFLALAPQNIAQAAMPFIAMPACHRLTPLPAPVLRLRV